MNLKEKILTIAISIIFVMFIAYGMNTFFPEPVDWKFCEGITYEIPTDSCQNVGLKITRQGEIPESCWCDPGKLNNESNCRKTNPEYMECQKKVEEARKGHSLKVYIIMIIIGVLAVIIGGVILKLESVSSGIMGGGVLTIIYGSIKHWQYFENYAKFVTLGLALGILIWLGYKWFKK